MITESFLNSRGWFYAGYPQVASNFVKGKFRMKWRRGFNENGDHFQISTQNLDGDIWLDKFVGYINTEDDFLTLERLLKI